MQFRSATLVPAALGVAARIGLFLAGCGGSHMSATPPAIQPGTLKPQLNGVAGSLGQPTLYVSGQGAVFAYDLGARGDTPPVTRSTGYYYQACGPNGVTASIGGIATNQFGDLVIAQNFANPQGDGNSCQLVYVPARTGLGAADTFASPCGNYGFNGTTGVAIGVTFALDSGLGCKNAAGGPPLTTGASAGAAPPSPIANKPRFLPGEIDVLMHYLPSGNPSITACDGTTTAQFEVDRYVTPFPGLYVPVDCAFLFAGTYAAIGGSTNAAFFVDSTDSGQAYVDRYDGTDSPTNSGSLPGLPGPLAVSANGATGVGYGVVAMVASGITTVYTFTVGPNHTLSFNHALGTFTNPVGALAVDNDGNVFVGVNQPSGVTKIKVYGPSKTQETDPDYILNNPVRRPNPAASPAARITGIAIAQ